MIVFAKESIFLFMVGISPAASSFVLVTDDAMKEKVPKTASFTQSQYDMLVK